MANLHGNTYDLKNGYYEGRLYNLLPAMGISLDGHYTLLFNKDASKIFCFKHGDYANLVSIIPVEFKGFEKLDEKTEEFLKDIIVRTMRFKKPYGQHEYGSEIIFDYDFEGRGKPVYWDYLN